MEKHFFGFFAKGGTLYSFFGMAGLFVTVYVLIIICLAMGQEQSNVRRNKLKYIFAGFGVMGFMNGLNVFPVLGYSMYPPGNLSFIPLIVFGVGIFKHDLLDTGLLLKKSLFYSILTALLTCLYALIIIIADQIFEDFDFSDSIYFPVLLFFLIAFVFGPLKKRVQNLVDRIFLKGKYDYQKTLKHVSQMVVSVLHFDEIGKLLLDTVVDTIGVDHCALFFRDEAGSRFVNFSARGKSSPSLKSVVLDSEFALVNYMHTHRHPVVKMNLMEKGEATAHQLLVTDLEALHAEIALPMIFEEKLQGLIIIGEKLSGDLFSPEDLDLLETLAGQTALAIENARSYQRVEDLNKNLEKKVDERTRTLQKTLDEKERAQELLVRSESLAALGQLVAGVAHELNNPLASVTGLVQAAIEDLKLWDKENPPDEDLIDDLEFANRELGRAKTIVASLLGLSRQTQTYSEAVDFNAVVQDALRVLYNQYKYSYIEIIENFDPNLPVIQGNFANLGQVALNIIKNAIQSVSDTHGKIFLSTLFEEQKGEIVFSCQDTGPGVPMSIRQDIFKPFFTTKKVGSGTGLGLYICHEIIHKHGGTIALENPEDQGARFEVRLPAVISDAAS
jgi:two-component system NtrC family sensor kinase